MKIINIKKIIMLAALVAVAGLTQSLNPSAQAAAELEPPALPAGCESLEVEAGNEPLFHVYASGVQIYRWNGAAWTFVAPSAALYADPNYKGQVGTHYAGPTWESNSGSRVVAARTAGCTPDASAIPWLKLETVSTGGRGIFRKVSFIQRVNTKGGLAPSTPGTTVGEERGVEYAAEYYFYRAEN